MKALRLLGHKPDAIRFGKCLIGSPVFMRMGHEIDTGELVGVYDELFITCGCGLNSYSEIIIPAETMKICPFICVRERISDMSIDDLCSIDGVEETEC